MEIRDCLFQEGDGDDRGFLIGELPYRQLQMVLRKFLELPSFNLKMVLRKSFSRQSRYASQFKDLPVIYPPHLYF